MPAPEFLILGEDSWQKSTELLGPYAEAGVEAGLYWYGTRDTRCAAVTVVGIPQQTNRKRNFQVTAEDLATLVRKLRRPLVVVAQVHTHPGADTKHSQWDDDLVVSRKILSLVLPNYARGPRLEDAGVHEFRENGWHRISHGEAARRIVLTPSLLDTRT